MTTSLDQAILYFIDLRLQVRSNPAARDIVDRCLTLLTAAKAADAATLTRLESEVEVLREELQVRFGKRPPVTVN